MEKREHNEKEKDVQPQPPVQEKNTKNMVCNDELFLKDLKAIVDDTERLND
ncbi:hypothetical protein [Domibacillus epiphyticus]|uniref:hypothetical protein n=1 Tax=Domibacillus epiphyticus TaxID=1714355 RepID=UPI00130132A5|nr:hypothetical protein [Domibacillus epiphyticus]